LWFWACIALGAEQTVEALHWRHKILDAADAMRLEMRDDNGPQAYTRVAVSSTVGVDPNDQIKTMRGS
jgi:hypothetical protein